MIPSEMGGQSVRVHKRKLRKKNERIRTCNARSKYSSAMATL